MAGNGFKMASRSKKISEEEVHGFVTATEKPNTNRNH